MLADFEAHVGRSMALSMHYHGWNKTFPGGDEADDAAHGRIPVIAWNCGVPNARVASGLEDTNIAEHADALAKFGRPVFLRWFWEMNLPDTSNGRTACHDPSTDDPNGRFNAAQFVAAWRHVRGIFVARGATNVVWVWNPSSSPGGAPSPALYYPGDSNVDWIGIDEYDRTDVSFDDTFTLYAALSAHGKPILIAETGATEANQRAFFQRAVPALESSFPLVKGLMYFDSAGAVDWHLSADGLGEFTTMAAAPYFAARPPAGAGMR
jgi:beta-mannanase